MLDNLKIYIRKIPIDFFQVFTFDIITKFLSVILGILIIRNLTIIQYAEFVKFTSFSGFILGVFGTGISLSFVRYSAELLSRGRESVIKRLHILSILLLGGVFCLGTLMLPVIKNIYSTSYIISIFALVYGFLLSILRLNQFYFQAKENYVKSGLLDNFKNIFLFVITSLIFIIVDNISMPIVLSLYILSGVVVSIIGFIQIYKVSEFSLMKSIKESVSEFKEMVNESLWLILYSILLNLFNQIDVIMLSNLRTEADVAMYGVAFKYYSLLLMLLPSIQSVMRVRTSKKDYVDNANKRIDFTKTWVKKTYKFIAIFVILTILLSDIIMPLLNGEAYNNSIGAFKILVVGVGISYIFAPNVSIMMSARKHKQLCLIAFFAMTLNVITNYLFIPVWGIYAASFTTILSQAILNVTATINILRNPIK